MARTAVLAAFVLAVPSAADEPGGKPNPEPVSPRLVRTLPHPDPTSAIRFLRYSADGRRLAAAGYPTWILQIWDPSAGKEVARVTPPASESCPDGFGALTADWKTAFTPYEGRKVVQIEAIPEKRTIIEYDGEVRVWDVATGKQRPPIKLAPGRGTAEALASPDGTKLITIETQSYDATGNALIPFALVYRDFASSGAPIGLADGYGMAAFAPDGRAFALTNVNRENGRSRLRLFDALTGKEKMLLADEPKANLFFPAFSPDGKRVAAEIRDWAAMASVIKVWDRESGKEVAVLKPKDPAFLFSLEFSPGGRFVTARGRTDTRYIWDAASGAAVVVHHFGQNGISRAAAFSPDNRIGAVVGGPRPVGPDVDPTHHPQPRIVLYDLSTGKPVETLICPPGFPATAAFSPDGKTLALGGSGAVHLFDVADVMRGGTPH